MQADSMGLTAHCQGEFLTKSGCIKSTCPSPICTGILAVPAAQHDLSCVAIQDRMGAAMMKDESIEIW